MMKWTTNAEDFTLIQKIADRAAIMTQSLAIDYDRLTCMMDLECVHQRVPLRLADLLAADKTNFTHDILGIRRHLNRTTGELAGFFVPRFAQPAKKA